MFCQKSTYMLTAESRFICVYAAAAASLVCSIFLDVSLPLLIYKELKADS